MEASTSTDQGYGCSVDELQALMEIRGAEALEKIRQDYGSVQELCARLRTDPNRGLTSARVEQSRQAFGANVVPPASRGLQAKIDDKAKFAVIRDGKCEQIVVADLVVGDICQVRQGELLPVDGIVIESNNLKIDESELTGEVDLIKKDVDTDPMLLAGTRVMEGSGRMIITAVGVNSQTGIIIQLPHAANDKKKDGTADDDRIVVTDENFPPKEDFDFEIKQKDQYLKRTTDF